MFNYLRIVRPTNLIIIGFTILVLPGFVQPTLLKDKVECLFIVLKAICLTAIAASGYIINDYFDQKADAINKPHELWVGVSITGKRAILIHIVLSLLALFLSILISLHYHTQFYWLLSVILMLLLLLYTPYFKRTMFWGNVLVAAIVAVVPWWSLKHVTTVDKGYLVWVMVFFSFFSNWIREVIKDIQDIEGDKVGLYQSIPLVKGVSTALQWVKWSWLFLLMGVLFFHIVVFQKVFTLSAVLMIVPGFLGWFPLWIAKQSADCKRISRLMKIWMVSATVGLILLFA